MNPSALPVQQLVARAKDGSLSTADVDEVVQRLKSEAPGESTYRLLYVVGRTGATRHESLVASFLDCQEDPMLARLALQTLCTFWGKSDQYLSDLRRFVAGVDWDTDGDVQQVALSAAGEYLRHNRDRTLFQSVFNACTKALGGEVDQRVALAALARALGTPQAELSTSYLKRSRPQLLIQAASWLDSHSPDE
ncbi:hypothetical protein E1263_20265 [Kribbella antibiotica]|uniref:HEAT repeat domain-containing protein n=1 Tax=Kribbella antibiotica TaxID=190195 RepID=A0A4V2YPH0_9ACTN|nr:hypothetical protein [Kribbella antibiotica]TDD58167.1 hypothetical protein E1263_20265 [Kribbella antibiotica]